MKKNSVELAADRLESAARSRTTCSPIADLISGTDIGLAYQVQQRVTARRIARGAHLVGRKIGLTSAAVQRQIGVDRPDFGVLFDDMRFSDGELIPYSRLLQPKVEAELAFVLGRNLTNVIDPRDLTQLRLAVDRVFPAIEVVDSRIADWRIGITDTVADNASSGVFVIGGTGFTLDEIEPAAVTMSLHRDDEMVSSGTGRDCLGDPLNALAWLANTAIEFGAPLRAGDIVLSGALGPMVDAQPGDAFEARIEPLGTVTARFSRKEEQ